MRKKSIAVVLIFLLTGSSLGACGGFIHQLDNLLPKASATPLPATQPDPTETAVQASPESREKESEMVTITLVYDNYPYQDGMETDWGFSAWITSLVFEPTNQSSEL